MVQAVTHYNDPKLLAEVSEDLGVPMVSACMQIQTGLVATYVCFCVQQVGINCEEMQDTWATRESTRKTV